MTSAERRALVSLLARLPPCASFDGRSGLLSGLAGEVRRSESQKLLDLTQIVEGVFALGGDAYVRALVDNARMFSAGTPLDAELAAYATPSLSAPLGALRDALAGLVPTLAEARMLCADCGVDLRAIDLSGGAAVFWTAILQGALEQHALGVLVARAREEFPKSAALALAAQGV